ncbi:hypothetical protein MJ904_07165 [Massilia sp. MB5]|uniref:hypothetical protein n=1 Tax=Massilia sp. MB5 TaxID=2919578 RepID=UPI001F0F2FBA|nr:hypothetical protein [Massilia sp. MB5]UMR31954.1 hypothetical protein MJ904_07165 [Massilia sp. MB5]
MMRKTSAYRSLYAYPWDVAEEGVAAFAAKALERGLNGVTLAASYHAGKFLRPNARSGGRVVFPEDGVVYFDPDPKRYGELRAQPHSDPALRRLFAELAGDGRLDVHAWTVLLHNSRLGAAYPQYTARNAFGDSYVYSLCPAQPAVFEYAVALACDAARQGVRSVVLETPGWLPYAHGYHHEFAQLRSNVWLDTMLGLCFCDACVKAAGDAGIDGAGLRQRVAGRIDAYLKAPVDGTEAQAAAWLAADLLDDQELAAYIRQRQAWVSELVTTIRAGLPAGVQLAVIPTVQRPTAQSWIEGSDLRALAAAADWLEVPFYEADTARVIADAHDTLRRLPAAQPTGSAAKVRAILRPGAPDLADGAQLPQALAGLAALGIRDFAFYNHGLLRSERLDALGTALHHFDRSAS